MTRRVEKLWPMLVWPVVLGMVAAAIGLFGSGGPPSVSAQTVNNPATGAPTINGTAQVGEALTASTSGISDVDGLTNASFTYEWLADDVDISGATTSSYTLVAANAGKAIKVTVSFTDDDGNEESVTSVATGTVAAAPSPLTASIHDEPHPFSYGEWGFTTMAVNRAVSSHGADDRQT